MAYPILYKRLPLISALAFILIFLLGCKDQVGQTEDDHKFTNALITETSPYLLQHAHNPVNWRPWSEAALEDAKRDNKLVLVSIGYSSCHWCHVMEEETFEDEGVAKLMNDNFVNIKVDREERPDVDQVYMTALQLIKGDGGWPLNVITLPNGKPLYGGTYHTKEQWEEVLTRITELYNGDPVKANEYADMVAAGIIEMNNIVPAKDTEGLTKKILEERIANWKPNWDLTWGADKGNQKFMLPVTLNFLLDYALLSKDDLAKAHVKNTLDKMILGGVYDQVAGGFFRYSTDDKWKVPHFEKMLYDNAQLLSLYSKAYRVFKDPNYRDVVLEIDAFLQRELKNADGGYFAAMDADSDGEEGKFYVWKIEELQRLLGDEYALFSNYYNISPETVWEAGKYVLHNLKDDRTFSEGNSISPGDLKAKKSSWKRALLEARNDRVKPNIDDKIITSWNALLVNGYVDAYKAFGQKEFLERSEAIFSFLKKHSFKGDYLVHTYKKGSAQNDGFLEDYAFLIDAALDLYEVTFEETYLTFANELVETVNNEFLDAQSGLYRYNKNNKLISKIIKTDDGVLPSPNAVMAHNLFALGHIQYNTDFLQKSKQMLATMIPMVSESAPSYCKWNSLLLHHTYPYFEIAVVGQNAQSLVRGLNQEYFPNALVVGNTLASNLPLFKDRFVPDKTFIYVCQNTTCKLPVSTLADAKRQMDNF